MENATDSRTACLCRGIWDDPMKMPEIDLEELKMFKEGTSGRSWSSETAMPNG